MRSLLILGVLVRALDVHAQAMFVPLGDLPGGAFLSSPTEVSGDGSVVIGTSTSSLGSETFRWTAIDGMVGPGQLPADFLESVKGVSHDGSAMVGLRAGHAFLWRSDTGLTSLSDLNPEDISGDGSTVVGSTSGGRAARWTAESGVASLINEVDSYSSATAVSQDGTVVVGWVASGSTPPRGFRWTGGTGVDLFGGGFLGGSTVVVVADVSSDGANAVGSESDFGGRGRVATGWNGSPLGRMVPGPRTGATGIAEVFDSSAFAVSGDGSTIVGTACAAWPSSSFPYTCSALEAFIFGIGTGGLMKNLREVLVSDHAIDLTGWTLRSATGISSDGNTIVGTGTNPNGNPEAWLVKFVSECGDGLLAADEACDDANTASGDGCSATCSVDASWICEGSPSVCTIPMTFTLDSEEDEADLAPGDGVCAGATGSCTLRAAVMEANTRPGRDRIVIPSGTYTVEHQSGGGLGVISIEDDLEIVGSGVHSTLISSEGGLWHPLLQASARVEVSDLSIGDCVAQNSSPLIANQGGDLTLERVEVRDFYADQDAVIWNASGNLTIRDSVIARNGTENGALWIPAGTVRIEDTKIDDNHGYDPLIKSAGTLVIDRSTITRNSCAETSCVMTASGDVTIRNSLISLNAGGLTLAQGRIENSTISGNLPGGLLDEVLLRGTADVSVRNSTIVRNETSDGPAVSGIFVANSIVAENTPAADCVDVTSGGHNLFGTGCASSSMQATDLIGSGAVPLVPRLAPLRDYGGATNSHALLIGSPALDAGSPSSEGQEACLPTDQRGTPRPGDGNADGIGRCDIGAYELREACSDLQDNDGDGRTDALDAGCRDVLGTIENPKCQDGIDNDGDGKFDFDGGASANGGVALGPADHQCGSKPWKTQEGASCGLGAELAGVLALLRFARRRRNGVDRRGVTEP